ncbi:CDP-glucose 4,6-dehydratase [Alphaproteobacteria bacterium LSUCC0744]
MSSLSVFHNSTVLVTGHTGFKGSWLSLWLAQLGANVHGVSLDPPSEPSHFVAGDLASRIHDHRIDIRDGVALIALAEKIQPDFVFHLAAQALVRPAYAHPVDTWQTNAIGTINVLESLRILKRRCVAVLITSDKCYDNVEWVWGYRETDALGGADPYSASKGAAELAIRSYVRSFFPYDGLVRIAVGRAGNVIGGGDWAEDRIVPDCMRAWSRSDIVQLRNPHATRPWQHVLEPLSGYLNLAIALKGSSMLHGEPFNFGPPDQQNHTVGELVSVMSKHWNQVRWKDVSVNHGGPYESSLLKLNCDKALHHLGWQAAWGFEDAVRETALWYKRFYEEPSESITDFSLHQIASYVESAQLRGMSWAQ